MTMTMKLAAAALVFMAPVAALAAPIDTSVNMGDAAYCQALASRYVRYVGHDDASSRRVRDRGTIDGQVAVSQCRSGNPAAAIPVLERELINARVALPSRG